MNEHDPCSKCDVWDELSSSLTPPEEGCMLPPPMSEPPPTPPSARKPPGIKHDQGKLRWSLLPFRALQEVAKVLAIGATEYGDDNWQRVQPFESRYFDAAMRHLTAWYLGEKTDPKTGLPHLAHLCTNVLFLLSKEVGFDR